MKVKVKLIGTGAYSPSKALLSTTERQSGEDYTAVERRVWKERFHTNSKGQLVMPLFGLKAMLDSTASYLGMKVPGGGKRTFGKLFQSGVILTGESPLLLVNDKPVLAKDVTEDSYGEWVFCSSDGKKNSMGGKVNRLFALFNDWSTEFTLETIEPRISEEVLAQHLVASGKYNGIGRFRPQVGGCHGRFTIQVDGKSPTVEEIIAPEE